MCSSDLPIPWDREKFSKGLENSDSIVLNNNYFKHHFRHLGLYAYKTRFLLNYKTMPDCYLEQLEGLEQLRFLYAGYKIAIEQAQENSMPGVDTPEDLSRILKALQ